MATALAAKTLVPFHVWLALRSFGFHCHLPSFTIFSVFQLSSNEIICADKAVNVPLTKVGFEDFQFQIVFFSKSNGLSKLPTGKMFANWNAQRE